MAEKSLVKHNNGSCYGRTRQTLSHEGMVNFPHCHFNVDYAIFIFEFSTLFGRRNRLKVKEGIANVDLFNTCKSRTFKE